MKKSVNSGRILTALTLGLILEPSAVARDTGDIDHKKGFVVAVE